MSEQLLPCPFCGGKAEIDRSATMFDYAIDGGPSSTRAYGYEAYCTQCSAGAHASNVPPTTREEAARDWNRRFPTPPTADWSQAPEWALWWAVDADGRGYWYINEPDLIESGYVWADLRGSERGEDYDLPIGIDWRTLKQRRSPLDAEPQP